MLIARFHEKEAKIISQAWKPFALTIATNMAGRGTDIKLGGKSDNKDLDLNNNDLKKNEDKVLSNKYFHRTRKI